MDLFLNYIDGFLGSIIPFFLLLGLLIFVHELGHFLVAKFFGVRVEVFSLGFGKKLLQYKRGDTVYAISAIPLGGYVKMFGDDPTNELPKEEQQYSFLHKPVLPRIAIVLAGPLMNLFFAIVLFGAIGWMGEPVPGPSLGDVSEESAAFAAGFRSGDKIINVDGQKMTKWREFKDYVEQRPNESLQFTVQREGAEDAEAVTFEAATTQMRNPFIFSTRRQIGWIEGLGIESKAPAVAITDPKSALAAAGLKNLDVVKSVNGKDISYWRELEPTLLKAASNSRTLHITVVNQLDKSAKEKRVKVRLGPATPKSLAEFGLAPTDLVLYAVKPSSPADVAGLKAGDRLLAINGVGLQGWQDLLSTVKTWSEDKATMMVKVARDGQIRSFQLAPEMTEIPTAQGSFERRYAIGISPAYITLPNEFVTDKVDGFGSAVALGFEKSWEWSKLIAISMVRLVQSEVSARNIGGVISIGRVASQSYELGWLAFIKMMAIISINLFLLNLLPVPVLDGGHLLFFTIEGIKGSPLSLRKMVIAQQVGLVLLLSLMVFALFNDIRNLLTAW